MKAAILHAPGRFEIEDRPVPSAGPGQIVLRTKVCGVCTGELEQFEGKASGLTYPRFIGHEPAGIVSEVGAGVEEFSVGDRVVVYAEGEGYAEYVRVPAAWAVPLDDAIGFGHALGEPIACSVNGVRKADPQLGESVAIVGCGFMGLIMLQAFRARGVGQVFVVDPREDMLELAGRLGADHLLNPEGTDVAQTVRGLTGGRGVDIGVEAAGIQATLDLVSSLVRMEGALEVFGFHQGGPRRVDWGYWNWMAFRIVNGHTRTQSVYVDGIRIGMDMIRNGMLDMAPLVTHAYRLDDINQGFREASRKGPGFVKGIIEFD
jgi:threonine dehydrogenase-like Zn-dependent dehydrogenase